MRDDMHRKLIERGRWVWGLAKNDDVRRERRLLRDTQSIEALEELPTRGKIRPRQRQRHPSETFGPLIRFLNRRVGRQWDDVYSEIRQNIDPKSTIDMHIMQHLFDFVRLDVEVTEDGRVFAVMGRSWRTGELYRSRRRFYVHPRSGRLLRPTRPCPPRRQPVARAPHVDLGEGRLYLLFAGQWYEVETAGCGQHRRLIKGRSEVLPDCLLKAPADQTNADERERLYGSRLLQAVRKRQLSRKQLRRAGLTDLPQR